VDHLQNNGFAVEKKDVSDTQLYRIKKQYRVPESLFSCHTALVDGYVVEGHVPAELITRLLQEKPAVKGLAVPGMPPGSPGMPSPNPQPYDIFTFDTEGNVRVYARR
jgi:hypothetical protein